METMTTTSAATTSATEFSESLTTVSTSTTITLGQPPTNSNSSIDSTKKNYTLQGNNIQDTGTTTTTTTTTIGGDENAVSCGSNVPIPAPNFRVEGSGHGDSSVTVTGNVSASGSLMDESVSLGSGTTNGGSFPSGSEEMPLSLLSWYSEPGEQTTSHSHGECCRSNHSSTATLITRDTSSEEKENKTPVQDISEERETKSGDPTSQLSSGGTGTVQQLLLSKGTRARMQQVHVQQQKQKICPSVGQGPTECPRCSRRSKSGTTTPAAPSRTPRRLIQVTATTQPSSSERKPIKSILKSDSRGSGGSGSGSEKQSSMDSLGSSSGGPTMTRSDTGPRARAKFNLSDSFSSESVSASYPEDRMISKLKRIEKYATVRLKQRPRDTPLEIIPGDPGVPSDLMSKSMTYLEEQNTNSSSGPNSLSLRRQGSLRSSAARKQSPIWEPPSTRTSALRLQKMQETKAAKRGASNHFMVQRNQSQGSGSSHSHNSGSGESIHNTSSVFMSTPSRGGTSVSAASKEKHFGAKLFSKISSVMSQTTSSAMKRLRQDRGVQTEMMLIGVGEGCQSPVLQLSPEPPIGDGGSGWDQADQMKHLDSLVQRYKNKAIQFQRDYQKSEAVNQELTKQLQETQVETSEMIDFLQAEKSTLAESLVETETETKRLRDQMESVTRESQSRCSSLVRLSEQHKQEALKSLALLNRLEIHSKAETHQQRIHLSEGALAIQQMKQRVLNLIEVLLKTYKVPQERVSSPGGSGAGMGVGLDETDLSCSLLLPLIKSLANAFQVPLQPQTTHTQVIPTISTTTSTSGDGDNEKLTTSTGIVTSLSLATKISSSSMLLTNQGTGKGNNSFQNLNQAILERQEAERLGLEGISPGSTTSPDEEYILLSQEINELQIALGKLVSVIRVIVIHCDQRVSSVASNILQVLKSSETEKLSGMPDMDMAMAHVQKSLEAWTLTDQQQGKTSSSTTPSSLLNGSGPSHM